MQRMPRSRRSRRAWIRLAVSTMGSWKMAPIELRTARRRNGLLQVSPTIRAWALKAAQLRTSAPRFSALREAIRRRQEPRLRTARDDFRQRRQRRNFPHRQQALVHREAGERFQQRLLGDEHLDFLGRACKQRLQFPQPFLREQHRDNAELALQQAAHDLLAFGDENALLPVLVLPPHRAVRLKLGQIEGLDLLRRTALTGSRSGRDGPGR